MKKLLVTKEGYDAFKRDIEANEERLREIKKIRITDKAYTADSLETVDYNREVMQLTSIIDGQKNMLARMQIIDGKSKEDNSIQVGDVVTVSINDGEEEFVENYKLGGTMSINVTDDYSEISINSPIGAAIFEKKVGDAVKYSVNGHKFDLKIISKTVSKEAEEKGNQPGQE